MSSKLSESCARTGRLLLVPLRVPNKIRSNQQGSHHHGTSYLLMVVPLVVPVLSRLPYRTRTYHTHHHTATTVTMTTAAAATSMNNLPEVTAIVSTGPSGVTVKWDKRGGELTAPYSALYSSTPYFFWAVNSNGDDPSIKTFGSLLHCEGGILTIKEANYRILVQRQEEKQQAQPDGTATQLVLQQRGIAVAGIFKGGDPSKAILFNAAKN
eukprot:scaffold181109_cov87-Attheya_sp.AAC.1